MQIGLLVTITHGCRNVIMAIIIFFSSNSTSLIWIVWNCSKNRLL